MAQGGCGGRVLARKVLRPSRETLLSWISASPYEGSALGDARRLAPSPLLVRRRFEPAFEGTRVFFEFAWLGASC